LDVHLAIFMIGADAAASGTAAREGGKAGAAAARGTASAQN
jgi:hypothetical protein